MNKILRLAVSLAVLFFVCQCMIYARNENGSVSPLYFGPNALPVPEMPDGTVSPRLYAELAFDLHPGFYGDLTKTISAKVNIPLFSRRVNLSVWMPVVEFYDNTEESMDWQNSAGRKKSGCEFGNLCISTDIQVLEQSRFRPDIVVRAALITASGDSEEYARFYDAPAYFFDASLSKSIEMRHLFFKSVRLTLNGGFLCWQTDKSVQNDAYMYGVMASLDTRIADVSVAWQGYTGWQRNGDRPMVVRADIGFHAGKFRPLIAYEYGIRDYPFHHIRAGLGYIF